MIYSFLVAAFRPPQALCGNIIFLLPGDFRRVAPQEFQVVEISVFLVEQVHDGIDKVNDGPSALLDACAAIDGKSLTLAQFADFLGDGTDLLIAGSRADHEMHRDGAQARQL